MGMIFVGNDKSLEIGKKFIQDWSFEERKGLILTGSPGVGKTHLTKYLGEMFEIEVDTFNASSARTKDAVKKIYLHTQMSGRRLIILDECEGLHTRHLTKILKGTKNPVILCCNFIDQLDRSVKELCSIVTIDRPPWWTFKKYMEEVIISEGLEVVDPDILSQIARKAKSFRHARRLIEDPDDDGSDEFLTSDQQVQYSLLGWKVNKFDMDPEELIHWVNDNSDDPEAISLADIYIGRSKKSNDYRFWKYSYRILGSVRSDQKLEYPHTFIQMSRAKKAVQSGNTTDLLEEVKIDFSITDFSVLEGEDEVTRSFDLVESDLTPQEEKTQESKTLDNWT